MNSRKSPGIIVRQVQKVEGSASKLIEDELIEEEPLEIRVNGVSYAVIMRTPGQDLELAAGFCLTEGIVEAFDAVMELSDCAGEETEGRGNIVNITLRKTAGCPDSSSATFGEHRRNLESRSSCGLCGIRMLADLKKEIHPLPPGPCVPIEQILRLQHQLFEHQHLFKRTSTAHGVALSRPGCEPFVVREDVGRHNALDKAIGYCLMEKIDPRGCICTISGRISFEMVQKTLRAGISILVSVKAATHLAMSLAEEFQVTLVGRLRGEKMDIYTCPERILL